MSQSLKALIVEDNPMDSELLVLELEDGGFQVRSERVDTAQAYRTALDREGWDIIFSDHSMPHFSSFQALDIRNKKGLDTPFIILSGTMGEDLAVEAMKAGASDYFVKGKLTRLIAAVNRELQEARERAIRRQTELELEYFVSSLTHDLRTPILAEHRILELLKSGSFGLVSSEQRDILEKLAQSNEFVQHMVNNILFAYKYKQHKIHLEKQPGDICQLIGSFDQNIAIQALLKEKPHQLVIEPADTLPPVMIDHNEILRVFLNLIKNAIDYTPQGGHIWISAEWKNGFVRVNIQDEGPGLSTEIEPHLFTLYTTPSVRKYRQVSIGLGLYLSRQIVEAHGGRIGYERKPEGSLFYVDLPAIVPSALGPPSSARLPETAPLNNV